ncbi:MAG: membrane dipeptidase [Spirochaetia bacterium]|nr:membrane dipeptidase [Spirochaetia bacterium]NCC89911.1 membrane dipeptidase [Spirochaetia bacterium]
MLPIIDLHCDTIHALHAGERSGNLGLSSNAHVDLRWMDGAGTVTTCFALFVDAHAHASPWSHANKLYERFQQELHASGSQIVQVLSPNEHLEGPMHQAILSVEELGILEGRLDRIAVLASWGVRLATITWNHENELGYPHHQRGDLKPFAYEVIEAMEHHKILVDVSHLNDAGFSSVAGFAKRPFIASHSNARAVTNHSRNLSDGMIEKIADAGGIIGLNFCPSFLSEDWGHSSIEAMVAHAMHIHQVGGSSVLALGTDFDGISGTLDVEHYPQLATLHEALLKAGLSTDTLGKMWYGNALRVLSEGF